MKEIYNGETVALGGVNLVTREVIVDDSTGERANFTYDKTTGSITVLDSVDPDSVNPVTARAVAQAVAGASELPTPEAADAGKVLGVINQEGAIGWVEDQSGTLVQQQANWSETNDQSVSFIQNKPDLSVYTTTSAVNTALAGKQDTINDLADIRSGAAKGETAVQPSALDDYATTSAMNTALAGKQDTINDLSDIRAGAAKGETAVQPAALEAYATTSAMNTALAGKQNVINDLADIRAGAAKGDTAVQPAALEDYATTSAMNTALAGKQDVINDLSDIRAGAALGATAAQPADLPSSDELVPSSSSGDAGKILSVDNQGSPVWVTPSGGTTYSAGDGIDISNGKISVKAGLGLGISRSSTTTYRPVSPVVNLSGDIIQGYATLGQLNADMVAALKNKQSVDLKSLFDVDLRMPAGVGGSVWPDRARQLVICTVDADNKPVISGNRLVFSEDIKSSLTITTTAVYWPANTTINIPLTIDTTNSNIGWSDVEANPTNYYLTVFTIAGTGAYFNYSTYGVHSTGASASPAAASEFEAVIAGDILYVENPLPSFSSADANKVLQVQADGSLAWVSLH